ncbi:MAG: hypothetical protein JWN36_2401, partial [Microbacteriaceae bacterium]|nr:hypothetical protein [Microbacteriaceae bacterium]
MIALVDAWSASGAVGELVAAFGGSAPATRRLDWLDTFSAEHWDFRGGRERNLASTADITAEQADLVLRLAPELGLADQETPTCVQYDAVLMTGGMIRAG